MHDRHAETAKEAIERHGGIIDHADHQGVTAVFGLTVAREDDALRAVRAAAELRGEAGTDLPLTQVVLRVGVATGEVYLPEEIAGERFYEPTERGYEKQIAERVRRVRGEG